MRLNTRIARLERTRRDAEGVGVCAGCGHAPPASRATRPVTFNVPPPRVLGSPDPGTDGDRCEACGRTLVFRIPSPRAVQLAGAS